MKNSNLLSESKELWLSFKKALENSLTIYDLAILETAWKSDGNLTDFYTTNLFRSVASELQLDYHEKEYLTVDAILYKKGRHGYDIPMVLIESENKADSTENEIYKLCCLNAPLKVLFIYADWNADTKKAYTTEFWDYIISDFVNTNRLIGTLGIVVAEWHDNHGICFNCFAYDEDGKLSDPEVKVRARSSTLN